MPPVHIISDFSCRLSIRRSTALLPRTDCPFSAYRSITFKEMDAMEVVILIGIQAAGKTTVVGQ